MMVLHIRVRGQVRVEKYGSLMKERKDRMGEIRRQDRVLSDFGEVGNKH